MAKFYVAIGLLALSVFAWAQYNGIGLFDDVASGSHGRSAGQRSSYHK